MFPFTFNNKELEAIIKNEGLLYAVTSYTDGDVIEDKEIRDIWKKVHWDIEFLQDFLRDGREDPGYLIYEDGKYVILADEGDSHVPLSKYGMDDYVKTKVHEPLMKILKLLGMNEGDYGKEYKTGGITPKLMTKDDLVIGKRYNWLHEPGVTITFTEKLGNDTYMFRDNNNSPIAMRGDEVPDSVSEIKHEKSHKTHRPLTGWERFVKWCNEKI